jgi:hypothetical protein
MATMHIDEIKAMAQRAHADATVREGLFATMQGDVRADAVHAAWALTHLPKTDIPHIATHREELVSLATTTPDTSLRRITLALLERLDWSIQDPEEAPPHYIALLDFCLEHMMFADEPCSVRSLCMKLAGKLALPYPELQEEVRQCLLLIEPSELKPGTLHTRNKTLKLLSQ